GVFPSVDQGLALEVVLKGRMLLPRDGDIIRGRAEEPTQEVLEQQPPVVGSVLGDLLRREEIEHGRFSVPPAEAGTFSRAPTNGARSAAAVAQVPIRHG